MTLLTEELRSWIGREVTYTAPDPIGAAAFRAFALAIGDDNPLYSDGAFARASGFDGVIAPPTLVCETNAYATGPLNDEGYVGHQWDLPVSGCRLLRGGHRYVFGRAVLPSDRIEVTWRVAEMSERTSSSGLWMLLVESEATYVDAGSGDFLARNTETLIYQQVAP